MTLSSDRKSRGIGELAEAWWLVQRERMLLGRQEMSGDVRFQVSAKRIVMSTRGERKMTDQYLAKALVSTLPSGLPGLFNPWRDYSVDDEPHNGPQDKLARLAAHLDCNPKLILCGEAPGFLGCVHAGIAFTSERLLVEGVIPRVIVDHPRLTSRKLPFSEPSATIVWKTLYRLGIAENTILWNAVQLHPHNLGDQYSNRTPTPAEISLGEPALKMLSEAFPSAKIVAVGKKAEGLLESMRIRTAGSVRHPVNGGATKFNQGLEELSWVFEKPNQNLADQEDRKFARKTEPF